MQVTPDPILALDVGERRIGVALASSGRGLPQPLTTLEHSEHILDDIQGLVKTEGVHTIVVGLPRGMEGQETQQTEFVRTFAARLQATLGLPIFWQDEALTSLRAKAELDQRKRMSTKADVDALAATYILEDFLKDHAETAYVEKV